MAIVVDVGRVEHTPLANGEIHRALLEDKSAIFLVAEERTGVIVMHIVVFVHEFTFD